MTQKQSVEAFKDMLVRQGASEETVQSYCKSVKIFYSLYKQITIENLQNYKEYMLETFSVNTVNVRIFGMNRYLKYLEGEGENPINGYWLFSVRKQIVNYLDRVISKRDYEKLKRRLKKDGNMKWYFIVRYLGATGVRVSELIKIKAEHVEQNYMDICSKGGKVRRVFFPEALCIETLA